MDVVEERKHLDLKVPVVFVLKKDPCWWKGFFMCKCTLDSPKLFFRDVLVLRLEVMWLQQRVTLLKALTILCSSLSKLVQTKPDLLAWGCLQNHGNIKISAEHDVGLLLDPFKPFSLHDRVWIPHASCDPISASQAPTWRRAGYFQSTLDCQPMHFYENLTDSWCKAAEYASAGTELFP